MTWINTRFGHKVDLLNPKPESIDIRDIAYSLAGIRRFNAHTTSFYSVAEHSFWVVRLIERESQGLIDSGLLLGAHLHDGAEAYLHDVSGPAKEAMRVLSQGSTSVYDELTARMEGAIATRFGLRDSSRFHLDVVKDADDRLLALEQRHLMPDAPERWESTKNATEESLERDAALLHADWPMSSLRFPVGAEQRWGGIFLMEFARLIGGRL